MDKEEKIESKELIGKFLKQLREEKNMTQEQVGDAINYSRGVVSQIERGNTMPSHDKMIAFANLYGVNIYEIYAARRLPKDTVEDLEPIIDNVTDSIHLKYKKKQIFLLIIGLVLIVTFVGFLLYYFISSYNSVKVFKIYGESENYKTNEGLFIVSKDQMQFSLGIISKDNNDNFNTISLRYKNNQKDDLIYTSDEDTIFIVDYYGYNDYFNYDEIINDVGTFYIEIEYEGGREKIELNMEKIYENKKIFFFKKKTISSGQSFNTSNLLPSKINQLFTKEEFGYFYKTTLYDKEVNITYNPENNEFLVIEDGPEYSYSWIYNLKYKMLDYELIDPKSSNTLELKSIDEKNINEEDEELYNYFKTNYIDIYLN